MSFDEQALRVEGVYKQNNRDEFMQRIKLPGGLLSRAQAEMLVRLGGAYGTGSLHLTTRGSVELHGLGYQQLPDVHRQLSTVGLFSRGACGGAVRGVACNSSFGPGFDRVQVLLRHFLRYFSGNPHFEGLPKKFKIAIEAGYGRDRHLIQDLAFVLVEKTDRGALFDVWFAGGLGREPQAGILYAERIPEHELLPLAEAIIRVYKVWGAKGRRLKHMLNEQGEVELRRRIEQQYRAQDAVAFVDAFAKELPPDDCSQRVALDIFAGELPAHQLADLVAMAQQHAIDWFLVTPDQNIELLTSDVYAKLDTALRAAGFKVRVNGGALRICPGNHECRMGLSATRDLALRLRARFGARINPHEIAISGCNNSCAQPQLADFGIISSKLTQKSQGKTPLFDLYQRTGNGLADMLLRQVEEEELFERLERLLTK